MDPEDRITAEELRKMRGSSWAVIVLAIMGFAAAAGFGAMYFISYSKTQQTKDEAQKAQSGYVEKSGELNETIARLNEEINSKRVENENMIDELSTAKQQLEEEKARVDSLVEKVNDQTTRLKNLEDDSRKTLELRSDLAQKDTRLSALGDELQKTRSDLAKTQTELASAKSEAEKLGKEAATAKVHKAAREVLKTQVKDKEWQVEELSKKLGKTEAALQQQKSEIKSLRDTLEKAGKEAKELQKVKDEMRKREREIGRAEARVESLREQVKKLEEQASKDKGEIESLRSTLAQQGGVSEKAKALNDALKGRDKAIAKKDKEIATLKDELAKAQESVKSLKSAGKSDTSALQKELAEKATEASTFKKRIEELSAENKTLYSRMKKDQRAVEKIEKGKELEQVRITTGVWRTTNSMTVRVSDGTIRGDKIDLGKDLGLSMDRGAIFADVNASARFGFSLAYQEMTFYGRTLMPQKKDFNGKTFDVGRTVDSAFYVQQAGLALYINLGAVYKTPARRLDLGLLLGGWYLKVKGRMIDCDDPSIRASDSVHAPVPYAGVKATFSYLEGVSLFAQVAGLSYNQSDYHCKNFVEGRLAAEFTLFEHFALQVGYAYSNVHFAREDPDTGEYFGINLKTEGPFAALVLTF